MIFNNILLPSVLIPVGVSLSSVLLFGLLRRPAGKDSFATTNGGGTALGLAFLAAFVAMTAWPRFPPVEATQRLFFLILVALPLSLAAKRLSNRLWLMAVGIFSVPSLILVLQAQIEYRWTLPISVLWVTGLTLTAVLIAWSCTLSIARANQPSGFPTPWAAVIRPTLLGGSALCLGLSGSALLGQLMGALAAASATIEAWQLIQRKRVWANSDALIWTIAVGGLILIATFYADLAPGPAVLLTASLLLLGGNRPGAPAALRLACLLPLAIATSLVLWAELNQSQDEYYYDYGNQPAEASPGDSR